MAQGYEPLWSQPYIPDTPSAPPSTPPTTAPIQQAPVWSQPYIPDPTWREKYLPSEAQWMLQKWDQANESYFPPREPTAPQFHQTLSDLGVPKDINYYSTLIPRFGDWAYEHLARPAASPVGIATLPLTYLKAARPALGVMAGGFGLAGLSESAPAVRDNPTFENILTAGLHLGMTSIPFKGKGGLPVEAAPPPPRGTQLNLPFEPGNYGDTLRETPFQAKPPTPPVNPVDVRARAMSAIDQQTQQQIFELEVQKSIATRENRWDVVQQIDQEILRARVEDSVARRNWQPEPPPVDTPAPVFPEMPAGQGELPYTLWRNNGRFQSAADTEPSARVGVSRPFFAEQAIPPPDAAPPVPPEAPVVPPVQAPAGSAAVPGVMERGAAVFPEIEVGKPLPEQLARGNWDKDTILLARQLGYEPGGVMQDGSGRSIMRLKGATSDAGTTPTATPTSPGGIQPIIGGKYILTADRVSDTRIAKFIKSGWDLVDVNANGDHTFQRKGPRSERGDTGAIDPKLFDPREWIKRLGRMPTPTEFWAEVAKGRTATIESPEPVGRVADFPFDPFKTPVGKQEGPIKSEWGVSPEQDRMNDRLELQSANTPDGVMELLRYWTDQEARFTQANDVNNARHAHQMRVRADTKFHQLNDATMNQPVPGERGELQSFKMPHDSRSYSNTENGKFLIETRMTGHPDLDAKIKRMQEISKAPTLTVEMMEEIRTLGYDVSRDPRMPVGWQDKWRVTSSAQPDQFTGKFSNSPEVDRRIAIYDQMMRDLDPADARRRANWEREKALGPQASGPRGEAMPGIDRPGPVQEGQVELPFSRAIQPESPNDAWKYLEWTDPETYKYAKATGQEPLLPPGEGTMPRTPSIDDGAQQLSLDYKHPTAQKWATQIAELDKAGAPDEAYRGLIASENTKPLSAGETWRGRIAKAIEFFESKGGDDKGAVDRRMLNPLKWGEMLKPETREKISNFYQESKALPRAATTTGDLSFSGRQGLPQVLTPEFWGGFIRQFPAGFNQRAFESMNNKLREMPLFRERYNADTDTILPSIAEGLGVEILDNTNMNRREEAITSNWIETGGSIPGFSKLYRTVIGWYPKGSNRAFTYMANHIRANRLEKLFKLSDNMSLRALETGKAPYQGLAGGYHYPQSVFGKQTPEFMQGSSLGLSRKYNPQEAMELSPYTNEVLAKAIADFVNTATGRGPLRMWTNPSGVQETSFEKASHVLNELMFSPRLFFSRARMLNPLTYLKADPFTRRQYLKSAMSMGLAWYTMTEMAEHAGAEVSMDPDSADFGKIRIGNTRFDPGAGFLQFLVAGHRIWSGGYTSSADNQWHRYGEGFQAQTQSDQLQRFAINKLDPLYKFAWDLATATQYQQFHVKDRAVQLFVPLIVQDLVELYKEDPDLLPYLGGVALGMGTQTYDKGESVSKFYSKENDWNITGGGIRELLPEEWQGNLWGQPRY